MTSGARKGASLDGRRSRPSAIDAAVFGAGRGVRLRPLTDTIPKVLVPIRGRPLLDYHLAALRGEGIRRVALVVHYRSEQIREHLGDGRAFGLDLRYVHQPMPRGTGDALRVARPEIHSDPFVVCYADVFFPDEAAILRALLASDRPKVVAARVEDAGSYGRLVTATREGREVLVDLVEKDGRPTPALVNAGLYLLPSRLWELVEQLTPSPRGEYELTDAVRSFVQSGGTVEVIEAPAWVDIGSPESLRRADELAGRVDPGALGSG
jgi:UDP-N-acetylglucosamine diphosphorylase / glucose-1-phosphate thymidylyltransferase / UDP-N-acetylgalactosamine diphosphorylase / glucosamine-1-phosphate N-acetyltransferase / galactosamine-1-phosphate N-acetyltransferase